MATTSPTVRRRWLIALVAALALFAASCGDDDAPTATGDAADTPSTDGTSGDGTSDPGAEDGDSVDDSDMDDGDMDDADMGDDDMDDGDDMDDAGSSSYCDLSARQRRIDAEFSFFTATPAEVEAYFLDNRDALAEAVAIAPDQIRGDLRIVLTAYNDEFLPALSAAGWDFLSISDQLDEIGSDPELEAASDRRDRYDDEVCGLSDLSVEEPGSDDSGDPSDFLTSPAGIAAMLETEFGRQAFIQGMAESGEVSVEQAGCLLDNLDADLLSALALGGSPEQAVPETLAAFDACGISPDQFS